MKYLLIVISLFLIVNCCFLIDHTSDSNPFMMDMILVEGGLFTMGDSWNYSDNDALPAHLAEVDSFYLSRFEITIREYQQYAKAADIRYKVNGDKNLPVTNINWGEAMAFCEWYGFRLPTECEWEYAARSGGKHERYSGTDVIGDDVDNFGVHLYNSNEKIHPVGSKQPNSLGLHDMTGNVWEWIGSYYAKYQNNNVPNDLDSTNIRIIRGGCFDRAPYYTYERAATFSDQRSPRIGFRCAKSIH